MAKAGLVLWSHLERRAQALLKGARHTLLLFLIPLQCLPVVTPVRVAVTVE